MAGYLAGVRKAKNYAEFKKRHPKVDLTREGFLDLKRRGRTLSDEDLVKSRKDTQGNGGSISNKDRITAKKLLNRKDTQSTGRSIRDEDRSFAKEFLNRNDGGKSEKTTKVY